MLALRPPTGTGIVTQQAKLLIAMPAPYTGVLAQALAAPLLAKYAANHLRRQQKMMVQVLGAQLSTWAIQMESQAPGSGIKFGSLLGTNQCTEDFSHPTTSLFKSVTLPFKGLNTTL